MGPSFQRTTGAFAISSAHKHEAHTDFRPLWYGSLAWVAFSLLAVLIRGVRWEETYEHALLITGIVPYPEGHPCYQYCRNVFSAQSYLSALVLHFVDSPLLVNGYRNVLQLIFCTVPVFLLGTRFSGKTWYGHIAVVLVLLGIHQGLQSYYPIESWPHIYAIGQIGTGYALLVFALLLYDCWRTVWLLLGLMVAIHIGQLPVIGAVAGVQWLIYLYQGDKKRVLQALGYFALGLVPCVIFYGIMRTLHVPLPTEGAYAATGDTHAIWAAYTERYDLHRGFARLNPFWKSGVGVALVLLMAGGSLALERGRAMGQRDRGWVALYAGILTIVVGLIWLVHQVVGGEIPFLLLGWMPYRLTNHLAILLVPLALGLLARTPGTKDWPPFAPRIFVFLILLWAALGPLWQVILPEGLATRYFNNPDTALWLLCGGALAALGYARMVQGRSLFLLLLIAVCGAFLLAGLSPFALAALFAGLVVAALLIRFEEFGELAGPIGAYQGIILGVIAVHMLVGQIAHREHLPVHPLQQEVMDYLAERGESDAMLVPPYWDVAWLAKTRHPIFADYQAAHHMTYLRDLAPSLKKMHADVYGFPVDADMTAEPLALWPTRTAQEWRALAQAYGFDYVLAPSEMRLQLEPVLKSQPYNLYHVVP